jgi:hypothetical protein
MVTPAKGAALTLAERDEVISRSYAKIDGKRLLSAIIDGLR